MITRAMEDYLKTIHALEMEEVPPDEDPRPVATSRLAEALDVSPGSATSMVKKLAERNLVEHTPYKGVHLTDAGRRMAREVLRHHRLLELYLQEALGFGWDEVHDEADRLEHAVSPAVADRIAESLGDPQVDPHGDPIPSADGHLPAVDQRDLLDLDEGEEAVLARVADQDPDKLRFLGERGLYPGTRVRVVEVPPEAAGYLRLAVDGDDVVLGREIARKLLVRTPEATP